MPDLVNHPPHYTAGRVETIEYIEDCVAHAPDPVLGGLQWQALKYLGTRLWLKGSTLQDARKARFYLDRLIAKLESQASTASAAAPAVEPGA
jgi:hypothetical protein